MGTVSGCDFGCWKFHRQHAVVELAIRDLKYGAGLEHVPSGKFHANSAWLQCAVLAHNMIRWTAIAGKVRVDNQLVVARTLRTRLFAIPGRLDNRSGRPTLRMPTNWPWSTSFTMALDTLRELKPATG
ncbi:MAG: transposase [Ilumatobacteraceae bacterium]